MTLAWIIGSGFLMSCIAILGAITLVIKKETIDRILLPLVAFAAGSLIGGALLHMLPAAVNLVHFIAFSLGVGLLWAIRMLLHSS